MILLAITIVVCLYLILVHMMEAYEREENAKRKHELEMAKIKAGMKPDNTYHGSKVHQERNAQAAAVSEHMKQSQKKTP